MGVSQGEPETRGGAAGVFAMEVKLFAQDRWDISIRASRKSCPGTFWRLPQWQPRIAMAEGAAVPIRVEGFRVRSPELRVPVGDEGTYRDGATGRHRHTGEIIVDCRHAADDPARRVKPQTLASDVSGGARGLWLHT